MNLILRSLDESRCLIPFSSLVVLLSYLVVLFPIFGGLVEVDLDPLALIVFLDLDRELLQPFQVLELSDVGLELLLAAIVEDAGDDSLEDLRKLVPKHAHHDEHDQVEESKLEDDEQQVENEQEDDAAHRPEEETHAAGPTLYEGVVLHREALVKILKLSPFRLVLDMMIAQLSLVSLVHRELVTVPVEHLFHSRRTWSQIVVIGHT